MDLKNQKTLALISGICLIVYGASGLVVIINSLSYMLEYMFESPFFLLSMLQRVAFVAFGVMLLMERKGKELVIPVAIITAVQLLNLFNGRVFLAFLMQVFGFLSWAGLLAAVVLNVIPEAGKQVKYRADLWYLPAAACLINSLISWTVYFSFDVLLWDVILLAAISFAMLWLKGLSAEGGQAVSASFGLGDTAKSNVESAAVQRPSAPLIGGADQIRVYKNLLDSGVITQEEFEEKKKQALGL